MAEALGKPYDDLVSIRLAPSLRYLESTLSSTTMQRFPFEEFGLEPADALTRLQVEPMLSRETSPVVHDGLVV